MSHACDAVANVGAEAFHWPFASDLVRLVETARLPLSDEKATQAELERALFAAGYDCEREVKLGPGDLIDFMVGHIGIECKIKGGRRAIYRQCKRYCAHDRIAVLILATRVAMALPPTIHRKPCFVASLGKGWL